MNASCVDFNLNNTTLTVEGPAAKETLTCLEAGQYRAKTGLYKAPAGLPVTSITAEKNMPVIAPNDGQSWHTLYIRLCKTKSGGGITTSWPPNPNDAVDVAIGEIAGAGNGLLTIANKSETGDVIRKLRIDAAEIVFGGGGNPSFTRDMEWTTVLSPGQHTVEFMPARQNHYGITLTVQIREERYHRACYSRRGIERGRKGGLYGQEPVALVDFLRLRPQKIPVYGILAAKAACRLQGKKSPEGDFGGL
ncbi:MAG: hypothetical protein LBD47_07615 [Treponema sp.]|jgi:hypothetical protein|nr:hypothetical protein [Treponema sp.]